MKEDLVAVSLFCYIPYSCFGSSAKPSFPQSCKHTLESQLQTLARTSLHPVFPTHHSVYTLSRTLHPVPLIINPRFFLRSFIPSKTTDVWVCNCDVQSQEVRCSGRVTGQEIIWNPPFPPFPPFWCSLSTLVSPLHHVHVPRYIFVNCD